MRARVPITVGGVSVCASLALSAAMGSGAVTVFIACLGLVSTLGFCTWVLSANDRTERLERLIRAFRAPGGELTGKPAGPEELESGPRPGQRKRRHAGHPAR